MGIFNIDGPLYKIGGIIADVIILGLLWLITSIPIFTIGASTTAVYYVSTKKINGREGYLWQDFWRSFRQNFITSTLVFMTLALIYLVLIFNIQNISFLEYFGNVVLTIQFFIFIELTFISMYAFPLISRFEMKYKTVFKTAFILANRHILITISNFVLLFAVVVLVIYMPIFGFIASGIYCYFSSFLIIKAFRKYRPDLDPQIIPGQLEPLKFETVPKTEIQEDNETIPDDFDEKKYIQTGTLDLEKLKNIQANKKD